MSNCLLTKLKGTVNNEYLRSIDELSFELLPSGKWTQYASFNVSPQANKSLTIRVPSGYTLTKIPYEEIGSNITIRTTSGFINVKEYDKTVPVFIKNNSDIKDFSLSIPSNFNIEQLEKSTDLYTLQLNAVNILGDVKKVVSSFKHLFSIQILSSSVLYQENINIVELLGDKTYLHTITLNKNNFTGNVANLLNALKNAGKSAGNRLSLNFKGSSNIVWDGKLADVTTGTATINFTESGWEVVS